MPNKRILEFLFFFLSWRKYAAITKNEIIIENSKLKESHPSPIPIPIIKISNGNMTSKFRSCDETQSSSGSNSLFQISLILSKSISIGWFSKPMISTFSSGFCSRIRALIKTNKWLSTLFFSRFEILLLVP